jgi:uncharacterized repeat protein (TIGR01451 family)
VVDANVQISPLTATNQLGDPHTFTAHVNVNDGSGFANAPAGTTVGFSIVSGPGSLSAASCQTAGSTGSCSVVLSNASTPGQTTVKASATVTVGGLSLTRETGDGKAGDSASAVKTWVDAYITIDPAEETQTVGTTHVYVAHVYVNDGAGGYVAAPNGAVVSFAFRPGSVGSFTGGTTCVIAAGACTIPTTSAVVGTDTMRASTTVVVGGVSLSRATGTPAPGHANGPDAIEHWTAAPAPAISIAKGPKEQSVTSGSAASFTITVTNSGNVTLTNVRVTDAASPDCDRTSASLAALASMAPGASVTYSCSQPNVTASFTNFAVATGTPPNGPDVTASDSAHVTVTTPPSTPPSSPPPTSTPPPSTPPVSTPPTTTVVAVKTVKTVKKARPFTPPAAKPTHPAIAIEKSPKSQTIAAGDSARFTIKVTNTGDVRLVNVRVLDPRSTGCNRRIGALAPGASVGYSCSRENLKEGFVNVARAIGTAPSGTKVSATDSARVEVTPVEPAKLVTPKLKKPAPKPIVVSHLKPKTTG